MVSNVAGKKKTSAAMPDAHGFTVILEDLRAQFMVFGEALQSLREHMDARFEQVDRRFEQVDRRFEQVDRRFEQVDRRFEQVDARSAGLEAEVGLVKLATLQNSRELAEHGRQLVELRQAVLDLGEKLDAKVDRSEVVGIVEDVLTKRMA
jgi:chromosome segregation ATPase